MFIDSSAARELTNRDLDLQLEASRIITAMAASSPKPWPPMIRFFEDLIFSSTEWLIPFRARVGVFTHTHDENSQNFPEALDFEALFSLDSGIGAPPEAAMTTMIRPAGAGDMFGHGNRDVNRGVANYRHAQGVGNVAHSGTTPDNANTALHFQTTATAIGGSPESSRVLYRAQYHHATRPVTFLRIKSYSTKQDGLCLMS